MKQVREIAVQIIRLCPFVRNIYIYIWNAYIGINSLDSVSRQQVVIITDWYFFVSNQVPRRYRVLSVTYAVLLSTTCGTQYSQVPQVVYSILSSGLPYVHHE